MPERHRKLPDRAKHFQPIAECDAEVLEILIGQVGENREINAVFSKTLGVLGHAKLFEPIRNPLHCGAPLDGRYGVSARIADRRSDVNSPLGLRLTRCAQVSRTWGQGGENIVGRYGSANALEFKLPNRFDSDGIFDRHQHSRTN